MFQVKILTKNNNVLQFFGLKLDRRFFAVCFQTGFRTDVHD